MLAAIEVVLLAAGVAMDAPASVARDAPAPPPIARPAPRLWLEAQLGFDAPAHAAALALVYDARDWLSVGAGVGIDADSPGFALFARARLVRAGRFAFGPALTVSRGGRVDDESYQRPGYTPDHLTWMWRPAYRVDAAVAAETSGSQLRARIEGGIGYMLNDPSCRYQNLTGAYEGDCDTAAIPAYYHFSRPPGLWAPYVAFSFGVAVPPRTPATGAVVSAPAPDAAPGPTVARWYGPPSVIMDVVSVPVAFADTSTARTLVLGAMIYALGSPLNHVAHSHGSRALLSFGIRAIGAALAVVAFVNALDTDPSGEGHLSINDSVLLAPLALLTPMIIDDAFLCRDRVPAPGPVSSPSAATLVPRVMLSEHAGVVSLGGTF